MRAFGSPTQTLLPVDDAVQRVLAEICPLDGETVPLAEVHGRVVSGDVRAPADVPPEDNSGMDGYAVRAADTPGSLRVIEDLPAGRQPARAVEPGTAIRIM